MSWTSWTWSILSITFVRSISIENKYLKHQTLNCIWVSLRFDELTIHYNLIVLLKYSSNQKWIQCLLSISNKCHVNCCSKSILNVTEQIQFVIKSRSKRINMIGLKIFAKVYWLNKMNTFGTFLSYIIWKGVS
jgi:hypothetical protein